MSKSKHTSGKLNVVKYSLENSNGIAIAQVFGVGRLNERDGIATANAERLVKCWNSHEPGGSHAKMLDACRIIFAIADCDEEELPGELPGSFIRIKNIAKAAIADVEKGGPL